MKQYSTWKPYDDAHSLLTILSLLQLSGSIKNNNLREKENLPFFVDNGVDNKTTARTAHGNMATPGRLHFQATIPKDAFLPLSIPVSKMGSTLLW